MAITKDVAFFELVTAANMAGVDQAKAGFFSMNKSTLALAASLGALIFVGKSAIDNTEEMEKANRALSQAAEVSRLKFGDLKRAFDAWAESNKRYIPDQYAAETALAAFVRTGVGAKTAMRELNVALDFSILRGIALVDAQKNITLAMTGSQKATHLLGITTAEMAHIMKSTHSVAWKHAQILALIEKHTKDGRKAQTDMSQSTQALNKDWQDITTKVGPPLISLFTTVVGWVDKLVKGLDDLGHNKDWNKFLTKAFGNLQGQVVEDIQWIERLLGLLGIHIPGPSGTVGKGAQSGKGAPRPGGMVGAGSDDLRRTPVVIHINGGVFMDHGPTLDALANTLVRRLATNPGT